MNDKQKVIQTCKRRGVTHILYRSAQTICDMSLSDEDTIQPDGDIENVNCQECLDRMRAFEWLYKQDKESKMHRRCAIIWMLGAILYFVMCAFFQKDINFLCGSVFLVFSAMDYYIHRNIQSKIERITGCRR